jgi:hypothetical protein
MPELTPHARQHTETRRMVQNIRFIPPSLRLGHIDTPRLAWTRICRLLCHSINRQFVLKAAMVSVVTDAPGHSTRLERAWS